MSTDLYVVPKEINCEQNEKRETLQLTFSYSKNMANVEAFDWVISPNITLLFLNIVVKVQIRIIFFFLRYL